MSSFVDTFEVGRSEEELQEDEELIAAVEELVETAAVSVWSGIVEDFTNLASQLKEWQVYLFPLLVEYQQDPNRFWQDVGNLAIYLALFVVTFYALAPFSSWRRRSSGETAGAAGVGGLAAVGSHHNLIRTAFDYSYSPSTPRSEESETQSDLIIEEETDEERFEKLWPKSIATSKYNRLVLPPICRRVQASEQQQRALAAAAAAALQQQQSEQQQQQQDDADDAGGGDAGAADDDNPAQRLQTYVRHLFILLRSLISFDYVGVGRTIMSWLQGIRQYRRTNSDLAMAPSQAQEVVTPAVAADASSASEEQQQQQPSQRKPQRPRQQKDCDETAASSVASASSITADHGEHGHSPMHSLQRRNSDADAALSNADDLKHRLAHLDLSSSSPFGTPKQGRMRSDSDSAGEEKKDSGSTSSPLFPLPLSSSSSTRLERDQSGSSIYYDMGVAPSLSGETTDTAADQNANSRTLATTSNAATPMQRMEKPLQMKRLYIGGVKAKNLLKPYSATPTNRDFILNARASSPANGLISPSSAADESNDVDTIEHAPSRVLPDMPTDETSPTGTELTAGGGGGGGLPSRKSHTFFFETVSTRDSLKKMSVEVPVPDKNGYIVGDDFLPNSKYTPLLVFVNSRSGPQQGHLLITQLRRLLNPIQVWDLANGGPEAILESFCVLTRLRILVCGGDGTVSWIITALEKMKLARKWPPIAILPLGTGNDLARVHGWGGGYNNESLIGILEQISESYISMLDRWEVTIEDEKKKKVVKNCFNYLGVGADAQAALQVHYLRESRPDWFFSRMVNKAWYGVFGAEDIIKASSVHVRKNIKLYADGVEIPLPHDSQGIILLNIDSYAGGVPIWSHGVRLERSDSIGVSSLRPLLTRSQSLGQVFGSRGSLRRSNSLDSIDDSVQLNPSASERHANLSAEERFAAVTSCALPSSCQDGLLDVVSIRGIFHLGQIKVGLSNAQRLCQCREVKIVIKNKLPVQVDGEPWRQRPCTIQIRRKRDTVRKEYSQVAMLHRSEDDGGVETEMSKLLDWAEERRLIDSQVHSVLMKEFSRRIESKIRQRRRGRQAGDNIMSTLKKAISSGAVSNLSGGGGQTNSVWAEQGGAVAF